MRHVIYEGTKLSKLALGTVQFGLDYGISNASGQPSQEKVNSIISYVISKGINCFDTAQAYGNSEKVLGEAVQNDKSFIISKLKSEVFKKNAYENVKASLIKLNQKALYALLLHDSELLLNWDDTYSLQVKKLKEAGLIKNFGVSIYSQEEFEAALHNESIDFIQIPFNLFDQRAISFDWFKKAKQNKKLLFIRSIFLQGLFFLDEEALPAKLDAAKEALSDLETYCKEYDMTMSELALSFVDSVATDALLLFGCDTLEQAKENIHHYNNLKHLDSSQISLLHHRFKDIDEQIYNPGKW